MSNLQKTKPRVREDDADLLLVPAGLVPAGLVPAGPVPVEIRANRKTALHLLKACVRAEIKCLGEVLRYIGDNSTRSRRLLEEVLTLEEEHAEDLIGVLQVHRARAGGRRTACSAPSSGG